MTNLLKTYLKISAISFTFAVVLIFFTFKVVMPYIQVHYPGNIKADILLFILSLPIIYALAFAIPHKLYEKFLWRAIHRRLRFAGYWECDVSYVAACGSWTEDRASITLPAHFKVVVEIRQTPFQLNFQSGFGETNEKWTVTQAEIIDEELHYVYETERVLPSGSALPLRVLGVGRVRVTNRGRFGFPIVCKSYFYHCCCSTEYPLFQGYTIWKRLSKKKFHAAQSKLNNEANQHSDTEGI